MAKMAEYFDAFRIDHILGFFRIWEIPTHAVHEMCIRDRGRRTHHAARGVALRRDDALGVEVDREVLVEEVGREAQVERPRSYFDVSSVPCWLV